MLKKITKSILASLGYEILKINAREPRNQFTINRALGRASRRQPNISTVIDIGASDGRWSANCMKFYPDAEYFLVEAQKAHEPGLVHFINEKTNASYIIAVAGDSDGQVFFDDSQLFGGIASKERTSESQKSLAQISLDNEIERQNLRPPFLLKLDTHGFEIPILEGAMEILKETELLIIETYNFQITENSLRFWEMCAFLDKIGFSVVDQADLMLRKKDSSFWQMDTFFIPKNHKIFGYNKYE